MPKLLPTSLRPTHLRASYHQCNGTSVQNVARATPLQQSQAGFRHEPPAPATFQSPLPIIPEATSDRSGAAQGGHALEKPPRKPGQVRRKAQKPVTRPSATRVAAVDLQNDRMPNPGLQTAQQDLLEKLSNEPGQVHKKDSELDKDPHTTHVAPGDDTHDQLLPLEMNFTAHTCLDNPSTACSRRGTVCLDAFHAYIQRCTVPLTDEQICVYVFEAMAPASNDTQPEGQTSQVDMTDPPPSENPLSDLESASSSSSTASHSVRSSPNGTPPSSPDSQAAAPSPMSPICHPGGKRQRPQEYSEDRPKKKQRIICTDVDDEGHLEPCDNQALDCKGNGCKKKEPFDLEYVCRICMIHAKSSPSLSCKDELQRHIKSTHNIFLALFNQQKYDILKPQRSDRFENLVPLITFCISLQLQAQRRGVEITRGQDLTILYPEIAAFLNHF